MNTEILLSFLIRTPAWAALLPIGICSVLLTAAVIERIIFYRITNSIFNGVIRQAIIHINNKNKKAALSLLSRSPNTIVQAFQLFTESLEEKQKEILVDDAANGAIARIERFSGLVSTIATVTPMFGLLGTVTGMMKSFSALSGTSVEAQNMLAIGIAEALVTTATGLLVAIPAVIFYNYMVTKSGYLIKQLEISLNAISDAKRGNK